MGRHIVGIDLGTTNSVVASVDDSGSVVVLPNASGREITPSVVYFEPDGSVVVGEDAVQATAVDPDNGVQLIKRVIGTEFPLRVRGQRHTPESISALILRQLVSAVAGGGGDTVSAVITVPAYFGLAEREATYQAGVIAGIDVLELLDEPVAAATHYGLTSSGDRTALVYDLGGGTFDTTVLQITSGAVRVLATDGHHELGGADVDRRLLDLILERLEEQLSPDELDEIAGDKRRLGELVLGTEAAKKDLSARTSRQVLVPTRAGRVSVTITRQDLDVACGDLYETTTEIIERVLDAAHVDGVRGIDEVIMVGGSSRIPLLAERLTAMLGKKPRLVEPDLAVAKGAALRAHRIVRTPQLAALTASRGTDGLPVSAGQVTPVTPRAVGILVEDSFDPSGERSFVEHLVKANTALPVERVENRFGTILPNQESVRIQVYEQAGPVRSPDVGHNRRVLDGELTGIGKLKAGSVIRITIRIAVDGRLTVIAHDPRSGRELELEAFVEGVIDSAETERLTSLVSQTKVRG
jgi:molecular chaperone DnaK